MTLKYQNLKHLVYIFLGQIQIEVRDIDFLVKSLNMFLIDPIPIIKFSPSAKNSLIYVKLKMI